MIPRPKKPHHDIPINLPPGWKLYFNQIEIYVTHLEEQIEKKNRLITMLPDNHEPIIIGDPLDVLKQSGHHSLC